MLFDNSGFGCINNLQMDHGSGSYYCEFRTKDNRIMNIDYAKVAEAYGAKVYRANTAQELKLALEDAKKQTTSTLIDMKVLPKTMTDGYDSLVACRGCRGSGQREHPAGVSAEGGDVEEIQAVLIIVRPQNGTSRPIHEAGRGVPFMFGAGIFSYGVTIVMPCSRAYC